MKKFLKKHLFQLIYLIPVSFIAIGSFVLNIYLNQFGIIDVALFDSRTIFVGFITVFQLVAFLIVFYSFLGKLDSFYDAIILVISVFWLPILFSLLVYIYSGNFENLSIIYVEWKYKLLRSSTFASIPLFILIMLNRNDIQDLENANKKDRISITFILCLEIISLTIAFFLSCKDTIFKEIYKTYIFYSIASIPFSISILGDGFPYINKKAGIMLYKNEGKTNRIDYYFAILYILILFMITLTNYSKRVFPYISSNMGGGYYKYNTIILEDESSITGKIIHSNSEYIYLIEEDDKLSQYPIAKIKAYEIRKTNEMAEELIIERENNVIEIEHLPEIINDSEQ